MARQLDSFTDSSGASSGILIATIADNLDDPKEYKETGKMIGRVKLSIAGVSDEISKDNKKDLPWAYVMSPIGSGTHSGVGGFCVPAIGTQVVCMKLNTQNGYMVIGELNSSKHKLKDYNKDYPETYGARDKKGNKSVINMKSGDSFQQQAGGTWLNINKKSTDAKIKGHVVIEAKKVTIKGDLYVTGSIKSAGDHVAGMTSLRSHIHIVPAKPGPGVPSFIPIPSAAPGTPDKLNTNVPSNKSSQFEADDALSKGLDKAHANFEAGIDRSISDLSDSVSGIANNLTSELSESLSMPSITNITDGLAAFEGANNMVSDILGTVNNISSIANNLKGEVTNLTSNFKNIVSGPVNSFVSGLVNGSALGSGIGNVGSYGSLSSSFSSGFNVAVDNTVNSIINNSTNLLSNGIVSELSGCVSNLSNNITNNLAPGQEYPTDLMNNLADEVGHISTSCTSSLSSDMGVCTNNFKTGCNSAQATLNFSCSQSCNQYTAACDAIKKQAISSTCPVSGGFSEDPSSPGCYYPSPEGPAPAPTPSPGELAPSPINPCIWG